MSLRFRPKQISAKPRALLLLLGTAVFVACVPTEEEASSAESKDLLDRLPAPASVVAWVDYDGMRDSPLSASFLEEEQLAENEDYRKLQELAEETRIDPLRDVHEIAFSAFAAEEDVVEAAIVASVTFDRDRLESALSKYPTNSYRDHTLYLIEDVEIETHGDEPAGEEHEAETEPEAQEESAEGDEQAGYFVVLDTETLLMGSEAGVRATIDVAAGDRASVRGNEETAALIGRVSGDNHCWVVASRSAWEDELEEMPQQGGIQIPQNAIEGIEFVTFSLNVSEGLRARLIGLAGSEEDARLLGDSLQGLVAMGKMMLQQQQPDLFDILDRGLNVQTQEREVQLEAQLTGDDIETLRELYEAQQGEQAEQRGTEG